MSYITYMPSKKPKLLFVIEQELIERIDDFRYSKRIPSRAEAIRRLIEESLKRHEAIGKSRKKV